MDHQIAAIMSLLRHENIRIIEKALFWQKNGLLSYIASLFDAHSDDNQRQCLVPVPVRTTK